jgi:hypothetical protein
MKQHRTVLVDNIRHFYVRRKKHYTCKPHTVYIYTYYLLKGTVHIPYTGSLNVQSREIYIRNVYVKKTVKT